MSEKSLNGESKSEDVIEKKPLFRDLDPDEQLPEATEIESMCVNCRENGMTKLLLTKIPYYKEVVIMSFSCPHCNYSNNELQSAGQIQDKGIRFTLQVNDKKDLDRQIVKSDYTSVKIPHIDFEIPSQSQRGEVTTIEGVIDRSIDGLKQDQDKRREQHPEIAVQIDEFIDKLQNLKAVQEPYEMIIEDISGNSWVENPNMPSADENCRTTNFSRKKEDDHVLGIYTADEVSSSKENGGSEVSGILPKDPATFTYEDLQGEILQFPTNCPSCSSPCTTNMKLTSIPYFKEVVIMATNCDVCGLRTNEVKSSGGIEPTGIRITVKVRNKEDLSRDILKSETCYVRVPEIGLDVGPTTLGGKFTTVEGLLTSMRDQLFTQSTIFSDSQPERHIVFQRFLEKLNSLISGNENFTMHLDDPAGNSFVQSFTAPDPDPNLEVERYERTTEQNEDLGLNDIKTENYENDS